MATVLHRTTKELRPSVNTPDFPAQDWIHNPDLSAVAGFSSKYWTISGDAVLLMNQAARDAVDVAEASALRDAMAEEINGVHPKLMKAFTEILLDELNARADKTNAILTAIDNATTLANLKTAVALIADYPQRTLAQLKTALRNKLNG